MLDQLPLTNPEHFGMPLIGKKSNRGGRLVAGCVTLKGKSTSQVVQDDQVKGPLRHLSDRVAMYVHAYTLYSAVRPFGCRIYMR
ncbi:uncharacterized protein [Osmerus mordax]|uniref:uncharacterized protein n=1 Tax=Osmerus mordax TaxID=8014 RepID=UPI00350FF904